MAGGRLRRSLLNNLYNQFGGLQRPIPLINPVNEQLFSNQDGFHWNSEKQKYLPIPLWQHQQQDNELPDAKGHLIETATRLYELERRTQLMELMFKSYYVDDEIFHNLYNAHEMNRNNNTDDMDGSVGERSITVIGSADSLSSSTRSLSTRNEKRNSIISTDSIKNQRFFRGLRPASDNTVSLERQNSDDLSDATPSPPPSVEGSNEERNLYFIFFLYQQQAATTLF